MMTGIGSIVKHRVEHGQAVHAGHLKVERDHVGMQRGDLLERLAAVAGVPATDMPGAASI